MTKQIKVQDSDGSFRKLSLSTRSLENPTHSLGLESRPTARESDHNEPIIPSQHGREQEEHPSAASDYIQIFTIMTASFVVPFTVPKEFLDRYTEQFCVFIAASSIFCTAVMIEKRRLFRRHFDPEKLNFIALLSLVLSMVSLISTLVPIKYSYVPFVLWVALLCLMLTWRLLPAAYHRLRAMMMMVRGVRRAVLARMGLSQEAQSLPV